MRGYDSRGEGLLQRSTPDHEQAQAWQPDDQDGWPAPPQGNSIQRYPAPLPSRPLILVGGFAANGLCKVSPEGYRGQQVWPPFHFDPHNGDWQLHGVAEVNQPGLAPTGLVVGQYEPLLLFLQDELGYTLSHDFFPFCYRWTESTLTSGRRLAGFIEEVIERYPWSQGQRRCVDVVSHSLGGLVTRVAGSLFDAPLQRVVYTACPFFGAGKSYFNLHPAHSVQVVDNMFLNRILDRLVPEGNPFFGNSVALTECFQQMECLYELLPDRFAFERGLCPVGIGRFLGSPPVTLQTWEEAYLGQPSSAFPVNLQGQVQRAMDLKEKLGCHMPGQHSLILYSAEHTTIGRVDLAFELSGYTFFGLPYDAAQGGDGTVPALSAKGPGPAIAVHGRHLALPNHRTSFYWIARFLDATR